MGDESRWVAELERLAALYDQGKLSRMEFEAAKRRLLAKGEASSSPGDIEEEAVRAYEAVEAHKRRKALEKKRVQDRDSFNGCLTALIVIVLLVLVIFGYARCGGA